MAVLVSLLIFVFGIFTMLYGADRFVGGPNALAVHFHISPLIIGMTVVAFGTSFPEFAASFVGALRGRTDISRGRVVGSTIFNILFVLGTTASIHPIALSARFFRIDIPTMIAFTAVLLPIARSQMRISRTEGALLLCGCGGYLLLLPRLGL